MIRLQHSSMQFSDPRRQVREDLPKIFSHEADIISGTESSHSTHLFSMIPRYGRKRGYRVRCHRNGLWIAVRKGLGKIKRRGFIPVVPGQPGLASEGGHAPRGIYWVEVETEHGLIAYAVAHWVTGYYGHDKYRKLQHIKLSRAVADFVQQRSQRCVAVFVAGDANVDFAVDRGLDNRNVTRILQRAKARICWHELRKYPGTHEKRTIDFFAVRGKGVRCVEARIAKTRLNKDHRDIIADYSLGGE